MNKKYKIITVVSVSAALAVYWLTLTLSHTKFTMANYVWQLALAAAAILFAVFGLLAARHWSWLKSGVGQGVFFISLGLLVWGIGNAGWGLAVINNPDNQTPPTHILDYIYFASIPLWTYGMIRLSKATGAKYGLRGIVPKVVVVIATIALFYLSHYLLIDIARGGYAYYHGWGDFQGVFFDIGYALGDAINMILALVIFGLSWKYLGGIFKKPILLILSGFVLIYLADFLFSYYDGKQQYFNGHWTDLLYLATVAVFGAGVCLLDPAPFRKPSPQPVEPQSPESHTETSATVPANSETVAAPQPEAPQKPEPETATQQAPIVAPPVEHIEAPAPAPAPAQVQTQPEEKISVNVISTDTSTTPPEPTPDAAQPTIESANQTDNKEGTA